ncbi:ferredoxin-thioredoxin reductase catalytic domain-containing protein [Dethiobacter alkaliphilus]|uniref:ferredoxin:thioredoxin reductase n=1 Tax=Dethiobacter alkaliphilus AHT 1 TaxID=555088 RepID=C0GJ46_DETAL|nr:ferredoxin-thioredoxin reductase catalytic domain-containing protein [Dethiobacter alkaliphilus]EEG76679.1 ferredoxin:thioredoxin reductase subunit [Dethiobacter alkaliphilus AHT 1]
MDTDIARRKEMFRAWHSKVVDALGYKFNPDAEMVDFLLEQQVHIERKYGSPFCPCQSTVGRREEDMKIVCPCIPFHRKHFDFMKQCWCGLFIHKDVEDPSTLRQVPASEVPDE